MRVMGVVAFFNTARGVTMVCVRSIFVLYDGIGREFLGPYCGVLFVNDVYNVGTTSGIMNRGQVVEAIFGLFRKRYGVFWVAGRRVRSEYDRYGKFTIGLGVLRVLFGLRNLAIFCHGDI